MILKIGFIQNFASNINIGKKVRKINTNIFAVLMSMRRLLMM